MSTESKSRRKRGSRSRRRTSRRISGSYMWTSSSAARWSPARTRSRKFMNELVSAGGGGKEFWSPEVRRRSQARFHTRFIQLSAANEQLSRRGGRKKHWASLQSP